MAVIEASHNGGLLSAVGATYADAHDAANADSVADDIQFTLGQEGGTVGGVEFYNVYRGGLSFVVPAGATMLSITLSLMLKATTNETGFNIVALTGDDLADTLVVADYGQLLLRTTSFGSIAVASGAISEAWYDITLNAAGLTYIQAGAGGTVRLGLRSSRDISNTTPKINGDYYYEDVDIYGVNTANKKPKLTIVYKSAAFSNLAAKFMLLD